MASLNMMETYYSLQDMKTEHKSCRHTYIETVAKSLLKFQLVSPQLTVACFVGQGHNVAIVQSYAPASDCSDVEVERFYSELQCIKDSLPTRDIKIITGDFNAMVVANSSTWSHILGHHGYGVCNKRGE